MSWVSIKNYFKFVFLTGLLLSLIACSEAANDTTKRKPNKLPDANAGEDQLDTTKRAVVTLDGSLSSDAESAVSYLWEQTSGTPVTLNNFEEAQADFVAPDTVGLLEFQLTVTDSDNEIDTDTVTVNVVNHAPVADPGPNQTTAYIWPTVTTITLDGSASSDIDKDTLSFSWSYDGCSGECDVLGPNGMFVPVTVSVVNPQSVKASFEVPEIYAADLQFRLTVTDEDGVSNLATTSVHVKSRLPDARAGLDQIGVIPGTKIILDGSASNDPEGATMSYKWTQLTGTPVSIANSGSSIASFSYPLNATDRSLEFQLVVNDGDNESSDSVLVTGLNYDGNGIGYLDNPFPELTVLAEPSIGQYANLALPINLALKGTDVYIPNSNGLTIVNATNPLAPSLAGEISSFGAAVDATLVGNEAFVFKGVNSPINLGLEIVDITDPSLPTIIGSLELNTPTFGVAGQPPLQILINDNLAYMADYFTGLTVVDIANRALPVSIGTTALQTPIPYSYLMELSGVDLYIGGTQGLKVMDVSNVNSLTSPIDTNIYDYIEDVKFANNLVYVAGAATYGLYYDGGLEIYQQVDRANFRKLSSIVTNGEANDIAFDGNLLYMTDGRPSFAGHLPAVNIFDISDPHVPELIGAYKIPAIIKDPRAIEVANDVAYIADYSTGLIVIPGIRPTLSPTFTLPVAAGGVVSYNLTWTNSNTPVTLNCRVSAGTCTITELTVGLAKVDWTLPTIAGRYKMLATVGNYHYFQSATDILTIQ